MIFNFLAARKRAAVENDVIDFSRNEVFHPVIDDMRLAQEKGAPVSAHERDYGTGRASVVMPVAFV